MNDQRTLAALFRFLEYLREKGLMKSATVTSRKATVNKVFGILSDSETQDVTAIDIDDLMTRFINLEGQKYTPGSLNTYKARLNTTLDDFRSYLADPMGFRPSSAPRNSGGKKGIKAKPSITQRNTPSTTQTVKSAASQSANLSATANILPIPLREDLVVRIQGLPFDLTPAEAKKLAAVISAMAMEF